MTRCADCGKLISFGFYSEGLVKWKVCTDKYFNRLLELYDRGE